MEQTLADNLYDVGRLGPAFGQDLSFFDINPERPYLLINATNATGPGTEGDAEEESYGFGNIFTFTREDFRDLLNSDLASYSVARAVMASMAFPVVFPSMTLRDYRAYAQDNKKCGGRDAPRTPCERHLHVLDGGNSDNLGLSTLKRILLQRWLDDGFTEVDQIVVISVDAFTRPAGTPRNLSDSRDSLLSYFVDTNLVPAVDSLLRANRSNLLHEFRTRQFAWRERDCDSDQPTLPTSLCRRLRERFPQAAAAAAGTDPGAILSLQHKLFFYHLGFDDVGKACYGRTDPVTGECKGMPLRNRLDRIPTSVSLSEADVQALDKAVEAIMTEENSCLKGIYGIVEDPAKANALALQQKCDAYEKKLHGRK